MINRLNKQKMTEHKYRYGKHKVETLNDGENPYDQVSFLLDR